MSVFKTNIERRLYEYLHPKRIALSKRYPFLKRPILWVRRTHRTIRDFLNPRIKHHYMPTEFNCIITRHQSVLRRRLGESDPRLQEQKIINLKRAVESLNNIVIEPGDIFSLWSIIGKPSRKRGYVDGMLLSNGKIIEGLGGGLCQLSNFLYWLFLHAPTETIERYHHSMDVFPDSGRTLPFGSGATILYNFVDLKMKNKSNQPLQLKIWLTDNPLKGQLRSPTPLSEKFHLIEKNHHFIKYNGQYFRFNQIEREIKINGILQKTEGITTNFAPVLYKVTNDYLKKNEFKVIEIKTLHDPPTA
ncbi:VanW family protein [Candidatus Peregrinibacteria bacterium]|nr:MAG: VanW family protein [Candidatus Peregrinibacteria bacterium]